MSHRHFASPVAAGHLRCIVLLHDTHAIHSSILFYSPTHQQIYAPTTTGTQQTRTIPAPVQTATPTNAQQQQQKQQQQGGGGGGGGQPPDSMQGDGHATGGVTRVDSGNDFAMSIPDGAAASPATAQAQQAADQAAAAAAAAAHLNNNNPQRSPSPQPGHERGPEGAALMSPTPGPPKIGQNSHIARGPCSLSLPGYEREHGDGLAGHFVGARWLIRPTFDLVRFLFDSLRCAASLCALCQRRFPRRLSGCMAETRSTSLAASIIVSPHASWGLAVLLLARNGWGLSRGCSASATRSPSTPTFRVQLCMHRLRLLTLGQGKILMYPNEDGDFTLLIDIPPGTHHYKYIVDQEW